MEYKQKLNELLLMFFILAGVGFFIFNIANAQGITEGTGTHFEINNSAYLNIKLQSSQTLKLSAESIPEMITIIIEPTSTATSSQITISGFASSTTYYKYEDNYHNLTEFTTNETGSYTYSQDISAPHLVFIQPIKSTKFISDNSTGGQCYLIGIWDNFLKTCTLTQDVFESIQIDSNNITLDGNGRNISGLRTGFGVYSFGKSGTKIKNLKISNFSQGIGFIYTSNGLIENNNISYNTNVGINIRSSSNNIIRGNTISNNYIGLILGWYYYPDTSVNNQIYNNNFINSTSLIDLQVGPSSGTIFSFPPPVGGNYWSRHDTPIEGCNDLNNDNICDSPYNFYTPGGTDNYPWVKQDGWKVQPPTISNLNQYKSDAVTAISESGTTSEDSVVFGATLNSSSTNQLQLQVELRPISGSFISQPTATSTFVSSGSSTTIVVSNLIDGQYHWQARVVDSQGNASIWQEFGTAGNVDFIVNLPLSYKAANLAKLVINGPYLGDGDTFGGKGWDIVEKSYVTSDKIFTGYNYWNNKLRIKAFGVGLDCSGLVQWAFNRSYDPLKSLLHNTIRYDGADGQYKHNSETVSEANLRQGDLLFFGTSTNNGVTATHVAMYVGDNGTFDVVQAADPLRGIITSKKNKLKMFSEFLALGSNGFRRAVLNPSIGGQVKAGSPIDLVVIDPSGFTITPTTAIQTSEEYLREVPGELYYSENEFGSDGRPEDIIYWPTQKIGDYVVKVIPEAGVSSTSTYNLTFQSGSTTIILAQNVPLSQIPSQGYGITTSATGTLSSFIPILIDIKPGSYPNSINLGSNGVVPVAIFGSATFDVTQIIPISIKLANASVQLKGNGQPMVSYSDVNRDGFTDIVVQVSTQALQLTSSDIKTNLEGELINGTVIKGSDSVRIVP